MANNGARNCLKPQDMIEDDALRFNEFVAKYEQKVLAEGNADLVCTYIKELARRATTSENYLRIIGFIQKNRERFCMEDSAEVWQLVCDVIAKFKNYEEASPTITDAKIFFDLYRWICSDAFRLSEDSPLPEFFRSSICKNVDSLESIINIIKRNDFDIGLTVAIVDRGIELIKNSSQCLTLIKLLVERNRPLASRVAGKLMALKGCPNWLADVEEACKYLPEINLDVSQYLLQDCSDPVVLAQTIKMNAQDDEVAMYIGAAFKIEAPTDRWIEGYDVVLGAANDQRILLIFRKMGLQSVKSFTDLFNLRTKLKCNKPEWLAILGKKMVEIEKTPLEAIKAFVYVSEEHKKAIFALSIFEKATPAEIISGFNFLAEAAKNGALDKGSESYGKLAAILLSTFGNSAQDQDWVSSLAKSLADTELCKVTIKHFEEGC